jgi:hypothetical protein
MADEPYELSPDGDPNLKNLYHAMQYSPGGYPELRVASRINAADLGNLNVSVSIGAEVAVNNFPDNQQIYGHVTVDSLPEVEIKNDIGNPIRVTGNVNISALPTVTLSSNVVTATQGSIPWIIQNVNVSTLPGVTVTNFPGEYPVNLNQVNGTTHSVTNPVFTETAALYYPASIANSANTSLNAGQSFVGGIETILNLQAAQIEVVCDQPYTVYVYQYIDAAGLFLSSTDIFTRAANEPLNENITLPGNYFNVKVTNNGAAPTTKFVLNTTFGIMNTQPRANTNLGNYKVSIEEVGGVATLGSVPVRGNINASVTQSTVPWITLGNVNITNTPTVTLSSNVVTVSQGPTPLIIIGNINVANTPTVTLSSNAVTASQGTTPWITVGNINVANTPTVTLSSNAVTASQGTTPWAVIGNVNANITNAEVEIKNDVGNAIPVVGNVTVVGSANIALAAETTDAFGRLRVSNPLTLFDSSFRYGDRPDAWNTALTGTATAAYNANKRVIGLGVSQNGDSVIRETKYCYTYQPGKSLLILNTFCMAAPVTGLTQRVGYYGARNGVFLEASGTTTTFVIRKDITGVVSDSERADQSTWNGDRLNSATPTATCPSGILLDLSKPQIFWMDIEWLGVGAVRCGFVINGKFIICHTFYHANTGSLNSPYMATASLPIRYEIIATGAVSATMNQICSTVISEGGYEPTARLQTAAMGVNTKSLGSSGTFSPLVSIRLNSSYPDAIVRLAQLEGIIQTSSSSPKNIFYQIILNATLTGASWVQHSSLHTDYDISATGYSGGTVIYQGYYNANKTIVFPTTFNPSYQLGRTIAGVSDVFTVVATGDANNLDVAVELGWIDLS